MKRLEKLLEQVWVREGARFDLKRHIVRDEMIGKKVDSKTFIANIPDYITTREREPIGGRSYIPFQTRPEIRALRDTVNSWKSPMIQLTADTEIIPLW